MSHASGTLGAMSDPNDRPVDVEDIKAALQGLRCSTCGFDFSEEYEPGQFCEHCRHLRRVLWPDDPQFERTP
jgi:hypothetical protein